MSAPQTASVADPRVAEAVALMGRRDGRGGLSGRHIVRDAYLDAYDAEFARGSVERARKGEPVECRVCGGKVRPIGRAIDAPWRHADDTPGRYAVTHTPVPGPTVYPEEGS